MNNLELTVALATAPSSAFAELRERPRFWFPLLLIVLTTVGVVYWYYSMVDIEWFKDLLFSNDSRFKKMGEDERAAAIAMVTRTPLLWSSVIGPFIGIPILCALEALYLLIAAKVTKLQPGFKHWFALGAWSLLPLVLGNVVAAILLFLSDTTQISPGSLQPLSLNELLFHRPMGSPGQALFESLTIPTFLSFALMIIGIRVWSQRSWAFSTAVVALPWILIYGCWAFFAFR